jgi:dual oxidase
MGLSSQIAEREDSVLCSDVRNMLFGPMEFSRRDLAALNIMRGRDNGLPDYNSVRKCNGLPKINTWPDINPRSYEEEPELFDSLKELYKELVCKIYF